MKWRGEKDKNLGDICSIQAINAIGPHHSHLSFEFLPLLIQQEVPTTPKNKATTLSNIPPANRMTNNAKEGNTTFI